MGETIVRLLSVLFKFKVDSDSERAAEESINKFAQGAMRQLRAIGEVAAAIAFDRVVQNLLRATAEAEDTAFKFENIYGNLSDAQAEWAEDFADTYNRSASKVKESLAQIQHEMVGFTRAGTDEQKKNVAEMSRAIEELGLNLGAFYGMDSKTAISTLMSAVEGSESALETFQVGQGATLAARQQEAQRQLVAEGLVSDRPLSVLSRYEKSLVNLRAVMLANGAATDALSRSQDKYSTLQENLQESLEELKETLGEFFLPTAKKIVDFLTIIVRFINDAVQAVKKVTDALGITEQTVNALAGAFAVLVGMRIVGWAKGIITTFGNLATAAARVAGGVQGAGAAVGAVGQSAGALGSVATSLGVILALLVVVYGVVSDINKFLKGQDSTTGTILEKLGIDAEKAAPFLEALRNILIAVTAAMMALKVASLVTGTALMATPVGWIIAALAALVAILVVVIKHWDKIKEAVTGAFNTVKEKVKNFFDGLHEQISKAPILAAMLSAIFTGPIGPIVILIRHFDEIKAKVVGAFNSVRDKINEVREKLRAWEQSIPAWARFIVAALLSPVLAIVFLIRHFDELKESVSGAFNSIKDKVSGAKKWVREEVEAVRNYLKSVLDWVKDKLNDIPDWLQVLAGPIGWLSLLVEHLDEVKESAKEVWEWITKIADALKNPFGKENPEDKKRKWTDTVADVLEFTGFRLPSDIVRYLGNGGVNSSTLAMAGGTYNSGNRNITQNITFNQEFNGAESMEQKTVRAADSFRDDSTGFLARLFGSSN